MDTRKTRRHNNDDNSSGGSVSPPHEIERSRSRSSGSGGTGEEAIQSSSTGGTSTTNRLSRTGDARPSINNARQSSSIGGTNTTPSTSSTTGYDARMEECRRKRERAVAQFDKMERELLAMMTSAPTTLQDWIKLNAVHENFLGVAGRVTIAFNDMWQQHYITPLSLEDEEAEQHLMNEIGGRAGIITQQVLELKPSTTSPPIAGSSRQTATIPTCYNGEDGIASYGFPALLPMPKLHFDGREANFMQFWSQFLEYHENEHLSEVRKYNILCNSIAEKTEAHRIVQAYPLSQNYPQLVEALLRRFNDKEKQRYYFMKEMLKLVISESNKPDKDKMPLNELTLKLQAHISALDALEYSTSDPNAWLVFLAQSSLPTTVQFRWEGERKKQERRNLEGDDDANPTSMLKDFMNFLREQVDVKRSVDVSKSGYIEKPKKEEGNGSRHREGDHHRHQGNTNNRKPTTVSGFHASAEPAKEKSCIFCPQKRNHDSWNCFKARNMTFPEKRKIMLSKGACFDCLEHHRAKDPKCEVRRLSCKRCGGKHWEVVCPPNENDRKRKAEEVKEEPSRKKWKSGNQTTTTTSCANLHFGTDVILQTVLIRIRCGKRTRIVRAFLDNGSSRTYILKSTALAIGLVAQAAKQAREKRKEQQKVMARHQLFSGVLTDPIPHNLYELTVESVDGDYSVTTEVWDQEMICRSMPGVPQHPALVEELERKGIVLSDDSTDAREIEMLIGGDLYRKLVTGEMIDLDSGPLAWKTRVGWTLYGSVEEKRKGIPRRKGQRKRNNIALSRINKGVSNDIAHDFANVVVGESDDVARLWDLETLGIRDPFETESEGALLTKAKEKFLSSVKRDKDGRYVVSLPWKEGFPPLPTNRQIAYKRMCKAALDLQKAGYFDEYGRIFVEWLKAGYIEELGHSSDKAHYIPHRPVFSKKSKTTPVRPVFDASCRSRGHPSLNDCLEKGPNLMQLVLELFLRFRERLVAFISDIKKAFQQIGVKIEDRDAMRFLWFNADGKVVEYRHMVVMFGAICSPFILAAILEYHLTNLPEEEKELGRQLLKAFYVDNCVHSLDTAEEYRHFREKAIEIMNRAKMELRLWYSNVENFEEDVILTVLGMQWDRLRDELFVKVPEFEIEEVTKREVLSAVQQIYDPMGFVSPAILPMKVMLQRAWKKKTGWDDLIDEEDAKLFRDWCSEVKILEEIRFPRMSTGGVTNRESWCLHMFSDASKKAYGAMVFLRTELEGEVSVQLLVSKTRLAPLPKQEKKKRKRKVKGEEIPQEPPKKMTITRLELMGCVLAVRLASTVKRAMEMKGVREVYHTDSSVALAWIRKNDEWGTFVGNRTKEINLYSKAESWRHVPGTENPADLLSRGCTPAALHRKRWWLGPEWLYLTEDQWPKSEAKANEEEVNKERMKSAPVCETVFLNTEPAETSCSIVLKNVKHQHTYAQLVRITAQLFRFYYNWTHKKEQWKKGNFEFSDLQQAERGLIFNMQKEYNWQKDLGRVHYTYRNGIATVETKLANMKVNENFIYPMILPGKAPETRQLIMDYHVSYCHAGIGFLLATLRKKYWVTRARQTIRSVISNCVRCKRFTAKAAVAADAALPIKRVQSASVFETTGVDLAGPLYLRRKWERKMKGGKRMVHQEEEKKVWLVIFTCAVYRAVHFEVVESLSTDAFIKALAQFISKYRRPTTIFSDNGTNFRGASNKFANLNWNDVRRHEGLEIKWKFNPPAAAWWGGWWERLIRSAKELLQRTVGREKLNLTELKAVVKAIEDVMNNRPLTYVSEDPNDLEPLTPALFLNPLGSMSCPKEYLCTAKGLRFRYNYVQTLKEELKSRFQREYLAQLVHRGKQQKIRKLNVGDLVFIGEDGKKRLEWRLGRIQSFFTSKQDNQNRMAAVVVVDEDGNKSVIHRAIQRLYPLELDMETSEDLEQETNEDIEQETSEDINGNDHNHVPTIPTYVNIYYPVEEREDDEQQSTPVLTFSNLLSLERKRRTRRRARRIRKAKRRMNC